MFLYVQKVSGDYWADLKEGCHEVKITIKLEERPKNDKIQR